MNALAVSCALSAVSLVWAGGAQAATYVADFTSDQVVPPSAFPATATATLDYTPGTKKLVGTVSFTGVLGTSSTTVLGGKGACGQNDPGFAVTFGVADPGKTSASLSLTLDDAQAAALEAGNLYLQLRNNGSTANQARGQLHLQSQAGACSIDAVQKENYFAHLDGAQVTSGAGASFTGEADLTYNPTSAVLRGRVTLTNATPTEAAIGEAACGVNNAFTDVDLKVAAHDGVLDFATALSASRHDELAAGTLFLHVFDGAAGKVRGQIYPDGSADVCPAPAGSGGAAGAAGESGSGGASGEAGQAGGGDAGAAAAGASGVAGTGGGDSGAGGAAAGGSAAGGSGGAGAGGSSNGGADSGSAGVGGAAGAATSGPGGAAGQTSGGAGGSTPTAGAGGGGSVSTSDTNAGSGSDDGGCSVGSSAPLPARSSLALLVSVLAGAFLALRRRR